MSKPLLVTFASVPSVGKSQIAHYLSIKFNLPIYSNDQVRHEVNADFMTHDINEPKALAEYEKRSSNRYNAIIESKQSVIMDNSVDRRWEELRAKLQANDYVWFIISLDFSKEFVVKLAKSTGQTQFLPYLDNYFKQHANFLKENPSDVSIHLHDEDFSDRLEVSAKAFDKFLERNN